MSKLSITVETDDTTAVMAVRNMLLSFMPEAALVSDTPTPAADTKPALTVVHQLVDDGVEHVYNVDGRSYTAADIQNAGFTIEHLKRAGLSVDEIVHLLGVTAELVIATPVPDIGDGQEKAVAPATDTIVDSKGMPWDPRIHAGTKTKIGDGSWKYKRGIEKSFIEDVEAELINLMEIPAASGEALDGLGATQASEPVVIPPPPAAETVIAPPPAAETVIAPPPADGAGDDLSDTHMTFAEFLKACSAKMTAGETDMARMLEVVNAKGVASLQLVNNRKDLIPELWAAISLHQKVAQ